MADTDPSLTFIGPQSNKTEQDPCQNHYFAKYFKTGKRTGALWHNYSEGKASQEVIFLN